jgi:hypothetical protein
MNFRKNSKKKLKGINQRNFDRIVDDLTKKIMGYMGFEKV